MNHFILFWALGGRDRPPRGGSCCPGQSRGTGRRAGPGLAWRAVWRAHWGGSGSGSPRRLCTQRLVTLEQQPVTLGRGRPSARSAGGLSKVPRVTCRDSSHHVVAV